MRIFVEVRITEDTEYPAPDGVYAAHRLPMSHVEFGKNDLADRVLDLYAGARIEFEQKLGARDATLNLTRGSCVDGQ